jgi:hypothetical protein
MWQNWMTDAVLLAIGILAVIATLMGVGPFVPGH